jgi:hypothetical protein
MLGSGGDRVDAVANKGVFHIGNTIRIKAYKHRVLSGTPLLNP